MNDANREHRQRDALDDIDDAVAQITDDQIEDRLRETLRRAGRAPGQRAGSDGTEAETAPPWLLTRA